MTFAQESRGEVERKINGVKRSRQLSASFGALIGAPAFWKSARKEAWSYLSSFGASQVFLTLSAADIVDPDVYMAADSTLPRGEALKLSASERGDLLARNPMAAAKALQRRVDALSSISIRENEALW